VVRRREESAKQIPGMGSNQTCPVCHTAEIISGKWTLLVIRDLADGCSRFCELERSLEGISPRTLSLRLRALEAEGIVERRTYPEVPPRVEYRLTAKGRALVPLIEHMRSYGREWLANGNGLKAEHVRHTEPVGAMAAGPD
jgi:DNA-binding HxlR family transcriptional regulator